jgi:phosphoribosyl 1,2-cyclic phosphodiesterase
VNEVGCEVLSVRSLGSGSSGNALLVDTGEVSVLIDCGIAIRPLVAGLKAAGRRLDSLDAVLLTHEHIDHARLVPRACAMRLPIVATAGTAAAAAVSPRDRQEIRRGGALRIGRLTVTALATSHDAAEPCGYFVESTAGHIVVLTDLGFPDPCLIEYLAAADLIVIEANHDEAMLRAGPYPAHLKRRILSATGHLANSDSAALLATALADVRAPKTIWLAHLSLTNNRPELARATVERALVERSTAQRVVPMPRTGHDLVWQPGRPAPAALQMTLPLT